MKVHILTIDDESIEIFGNILNDNFELVNPPSREFAFELHPIFRQNKITEPPKSFVFPTANYGHQLSYCDLKTALDEGCHSPGLWIIFLDLKLDKAGTSDSTWNDDIEKCPNLIINGIDLKDYLGLHLAFLILKKEKWKGLLCTASGYANADQVKNYLEKHFPCADTSSDRYWHVLGSPIRVEAANGLANFNEGLQKFLEIFGFDGLIRWWLTPPGQPSWFTSGTNYHNPGVKGNIHYKAVADKFGEHEFWEDQNGKFTKVLFESAANGSRNTKAALIKLLFRNCVDLSNFADDAEVALPIRPGLPFLWAVKHALDMARGENEEGNADFIGKPLLLKKTNGNRIAMTLQQSRCAKELVKTVLDPKKKDELRSVGQALYSALRAKVNCPPSYNDRSGKTFLEGSVEPIADLEWSADSSELRIVWPVRI